MMNKLFVTACFFMICVVVCTAQQEAKNWTGQSAPAELKRFDAFLGRYEAAVDWPSSNLKWNGSFEIAPVIKGWYIETNLIKESDGPHRHWRLVITWDQKQKKYRVWRFETNTPRPSIEGTVNFDNENEWHAVWENFPVAGGRLVTQFSRFRLKNKDELHIVTDNIDAAGKKEDLGVVVCRRKKIT